MKARIYYWSLTSALAGFLFGFDTVIISGAEQAIQAHQKGQKGEEGETAPYAISVLKEELDIKGKSISAVRGVRISTFKAEYGDRVAEVWGGRAAKKSEVEFGSAKMIVESVRANPRTSVTFANLKHEAANAFGLELEFHTPTILERGVHIDLLPSPKKLWAGYRRRWEQYAPTDLYLPPEFDVWVEKCIFLRRISVETEAAHIRDTTELHGLTGQIEFHALIEDDDFPASRVDDYLRAWQMLAMFSEFCGTGKSTTEGFGRTRYVRAFGLRK